MCVELRAAISALSCTYYCCLGAKTAWTLVISIAVVIGVAVGLMIARPMSQTDRISDTSTQAAVEPTPAEPVPKETGPSIPADSSARDAPPAKPPARAIDAPSASPEFPTPGPSAQTPEYRAPAPQVPDLPVAAGPDPDQDEWLYPEEMALAPEPEESCPSDEGIIVSVTGAERLDSHMWNPFGLCRLTLTVENRNDWPVWVDAGSLKLESIFPDNAVQHSSVPFPGALMSPGEVLVIEPEEGDEGFLLEYDFNTRARALTLSEDLGLGASYIDYEIPLYCDFTVERGQPFKPFPVH